MSNYEAWFNEVLRLAADYEFPVQDCETWRGMWDEGMTARDALFEEMSYCD